jgi:hypothetical protein
LRNVLRGSGTSKASPNIPCGGGLRVDHRLASHRDH